MSATDAQFQTSDFRSKTANSSSFNSRSRSQIQIQLNNRRRLRNNIKSRGSASFSTTNKNTVKNSTFFKSSAHECCDINSDKDVSEPFMDTTDHSLRETRANKHVVA